MMKFKNKPYIFLIMASIGSFNALAQVETKIKSESIYELSIIQVFPDSFPEVEVIFQARNQLGKPLWGISRSDISVIENGNQCQVIELTNMSEGEIIDIALVFDHSGSMGFPVIPDSFIWSDEKYDSLMLLPKPIDFAKMGVLKFTSSTELASDSILIVGFSSEVDEIVGPTQDIEVLESKIENMQADNGTAFYDALIAALDNMSLKKDQKKAIVALTDGQDNESKYSINDVIVKSKKLQVPIYVIGLGNVQDSTLQLLADGTDGLFYKTNDPSQLEQIYLNISRQLKSVYQLKYMSRVEGFVASEFSLTFKFVNDTISFSNPDIRMTLPEKVLHYLHEQEESRLNAIERRNLILGGAGAGVAVIGLATFLLYRKNRMKRFKMSKLYPNPFSDRINLEIKSYTPQDIIQIEILDIKGNVIQSETYHVTNPKIEILTSDLPTGIYLVRAVNSEGLSDTTKAIKQ